MTACCCFVESSSAWGDNYWGMSYNVRLGLFLSLVGGVVVGWIATVLIVQIEVNQIYVIYYSLALFTTSYPYCIVYF